MCTMLIGIMGSVAQMERAQIRERQMEGIKIAKLKGNVFMGRKPCSNEDISSFLSKPKNKQAIEYMKKKYTLGEISKIVGIHANTLTKIKRLAFPIKG